MLTRYEQRHLIWIDLVAPASEEVRQVMKEFDLSPKIAEELLMPSFKSKVEPCGETVFAILYFPTLRGLSNRPAQEIDFVIGKNFLITTRYESADPLHSFAKAFEVNTVLGHSGASHGGHLFVEMARSLYQALDDECAVLERRLRDIEERVFGGKEKQMVVELSHVSRILFDFRQVIAPHKDMLTSFEPAAAKLFGPAFTYYVRALEGAHAHIAHTLEHLHQSLIEMRETNNSLLTTKQNEIMKVLTIMAFVTFPLTLISSIFGMNTAYLPVVGMPGDFWLVVGTMLALAISFFVYFKRKGWL